MSHFGWTTDRYMSAAQYNVSVLLLYAFLQSKVKKRLDQPSMWPTPGTKPSKVEQQHNGFTEMIEKARKRREAKLKEGK